MKTKKTALLVGTNFSEKISEVAESLNELKQLSDTAGFSPIDTIIQRIKKPNPRFFVGCGKVEEIKRTCEENSVSTVIFDNELNPTQQRNLEQNIPAKIIDRTQLILDIFAQRAHTQEAKLQVELARNYYQLPRLTQREKFLAQQVGNIGVRAGFGEKKLEVDRRQIRDKISYLKKEIEKIKSYRELRRAKRQDVPVPVVSLVGYTNVGKSTLLNYLTKKNSVYADDKLFATLDATTRKVKLPDGKSVLFTDTVGFIKKLPHQLVAAFKSTLEEIVESNLIVHLIDITDENYNEKAKIVINVLKEIGAEKIPIITVYNKCDLLKTKKWGGGGCGGGATSRNYHHISAKTGEGISELLEILSEKFDSELKYKKVILPYNLFSVVEKIKAVGKIVQYTPQKEHAVLRILIDDKNWGQIQNFLSTAAKI